MMPWLRYDYAAALGPDLWQVMSGLRAAAWKGRVFAPLAEAMRNEKVLTTYLGHAATEAK